MTGRILSLFAITLLISCVPSDFELPKYQADFVIPVINAELSINDLLLLDTAGIISEDDEGVVVLSYGVTESRQLEEIAPIEDDVTGFTIPGLSPEVEDFAVSVPVSSSLLGLTPGFYPVIPSNKFEYETEVTLNEFVEAELLNGALGFSITNHLPVSINEGSTISLVNKDTQETFFEFVSDNSVEPGESYMFTPYDISGEIVAGHYRLIVSDFGYSGGVNIEVKEGDGITFGISYNDVIIKRATINFPEFESPSVKVDLPIQFSSGALIRRARIDSGYIRISMPELSPSLLLKVKLLSAMRDGEPLELVLGKEDLEIDLENLDLDLAVSLPSTSIIHTEISVLSDSTVNSVDITFDKDLHGTIFLSGFDYDFMTGYLGKYSEKLEGSFEIDLFERVRSGTLEFADPRIYLTVGNGVGVAGRAADDGKGLYIRGENSRLFPGEVIEIGRSIDGFQIEASKFPGNPKISMLEISNDTEPDFSRFLALLPTRIDYRIPVTGGTDSVEFGQFIDDESEIEVTLQVELPLNVSADRFLILDTLNYNIDFDPEKIEVQKLRVISRLENSFPFELIFQVVLLDNEYQVIDSLFQDIRLIEPAQLDNLGKVESPLISELLVEIDRDELEGIRETAYAVPIVRIQSQDADFVKLFSDYKVRLALRGEFVTDIDLNP